MSYQNFSHHHPLIPLQLDEGEEINCNACERLITHPFHGCNECKHYLHDQCMNTPRFLQHPSHPSHPLTLLPSPTYPNGSFSCNACRSQGRSFSFACAPCEFDLHIHCASLPSKVLLDAHPHELQLTFDSAYTFVCDVCGGKAAQNSWVYNCADCDFGVHLDCGMSNQQPGLNQTTNDGQSMTDDGVSALRQVANEMMETQLAVMKMEHQINSTQMIANIITWKFR